MQDETLRVREAQPPRPILVTASTVREATQACKCLKGTLPEESDVRLYESNEKDLTQLLKDVGSSTIIVATNLAGRGTDINISGQISGDGGLHVHLTSCPTIRVWSVRPTVEQQERVRRAAVG